jgi:hypothetical protein
VWPTAAIPTRLCRNNYPAISEFMRSTSGNVATLLGWVYGGGEIYGSDVTNPAPPSPGHGLRGHDHSGGVHGRPLYRSVATVTLMTGAEVAGAANVSSGEDESLIQFASVAASSTSTLPQGDRFVVDVPGCDEGPLGAYSVLGVTVLAYVQVATNVAALDAFKLVIRNETTDHSVTIEDTSVTTTGLAVLRSAASLVMAVGQPNLVHIESASLVTVAGGVSRTLDVALMALELGVFDTDL